MFDSQVTGDINSKLNRKTENKLDSHSSYSENIHTINQKLAKPSLVNNLESMKSSKLIKTYSDKFLKHKFNNSKTINSKENDQRRSFETVNKINSHEF